MKEYILVYQDCPMCGSRQWWGEKQISFAKAHKASIRKVSFVSTEGSKYCAEALRAGKASMPFFTDGEGHFGKDLEELNNAIKAEKAEKKEKSEKPKKKAGRKNVNKKQN